MKKPRFFSDPLSKKTPDVMTICCKLILCFPKNVAFISERLYYAVSNKEILLISDKIQ